MSNASSTRFPTQLLYGLLLIGAAAIAVYVAAPYLTPSASGISDEAPTVMPSVE